MMKQILFVLTAVLLWTATAMAHSPNLTALVTVVGGRMTLKLEDPNGVLVPGAVVTATFTDAGERYRLALAEGPAGVYSADLGRGSGDPYEVKLEAELWEEIFRTSVQVDPVKGMPESPFPVTEFAKPAAAGWELGIYGLVFLGVSGFMGYVFLRRPPAAA